MGMEEVIATQGDPGKMGLVEGSSGDGLECAGDEGAELRPTVKGHEEGRWSQVALVACNIHHRSQVITAKLIA